jgi:hypothetical protein
MNKLVLGMPLYHWVPAYFFQHYLNLNHSPVVANITVNGAYITSSCEIIVDQALSFEQEWDRLVILEHDVLLPNDALVRAAQYGPEHAVVGAMIFQHSEPHSAMVYVEQPDGGVQTITPQTVKDWCEVPMLYRCDATSFGFVSIARHVLENWDPVLPMFTTDRVLGSHDLWFCRRARMQGFDVFVDTGVVCEHLTQVPIGITHNQACTPMVAHEPVATFSFAEA